MAQVESVVGPDELEGTLEELKNSVGAWCYGNSYYQGTPGPLGNIFSHSTHHFACRSWYGVQREVSACLHTKPC